MTEYKSTGDSYLQVLTDQEGRILAAAVRTVGEAAGEDVVPEISLNPSEGQVLHALSIPDGAAGDEIFGSLDQLVVHVDAGTSTLVQRPDAV